MPNRLVIHSTVYLEFTIPADIMLSTDILDCLPLPILPGADLFNIFVKFASSGENERNEEMGGHQFSRMMKRCKLIDGKRVTKAGVDIIYWRYVGVISILWRFRAADCS